MIESTAPAAPVLMRGEIIGNFELLRLLSNHNGVEVWLCSARKDGSLHVLKRSALNHPRVPAYRLLYAALQKLDCPSLSIPKCELESEAFGFCVVSPFHKGGTLRLFLKENGRLPLGQVVHLLKGTLTALAALHKIGIVHRDVKPGNIYLTQDGDAMLGDFGVAKIPHGKERKECFVGSAAYASPEQVTDTASVDFRSDIFSLGSVMYEAITGEMRYGGGDFSDTLDKIVTDTNPPPLEKLMEFMPDSLVYLLTGMMRHDRRERTSTAADLLQSLNALHLPDTKILRERQ